MSDICDAIARARRDVEALEKEWDHDCDCPDDPGFRGAHGKDCPWMRWVNGEDDARDRLAALGPPSVALAVALWDVTKDKCYCDAHQQVFSADDDLIAPCPHEIAGEALQDWADAQHSDAEGA